MVVVHTAFESTGGGVTAVVGVAVTVAGAVVGGAASTGATGAVVGGVASTGAVVVAGGGGGAIVLTAFASTAGGVAVLRGVPGTVVDATVVGRTVSMGGTDAVVVEGTVVGAVVVGGAVSMALSGAVVVTDGGCVVAVGAGATISAGGALVEFLLAVIGSSGQSAATCTDPVPDPVGVQYANAPPAPPMNASVMMPATTGTVTIFMVSFRAI